MKRSLRWLLAISLLAVVAFAVYRYPFAQVWLGAGLVLYGALLWRHQAAWLIAIPALLPVLDLTPWSGRLYFNEFDIVILFTVAVAWWRSPLAVGSSVLVRGAGVVIGIVAVVQLAGTAIGLLPIAPLDPNAFANYYSPYNSLRVSKGFWEALLLLTVLRQDLARFGSERVGRLFAAGMVVGLALAAMAIAWERFLFSGLFNFDLDYRVTGLFSGMHTGGATVDCYLCAALPFAVACFLLWKGIAVRLAGVLLFAAAVYALLVTFSRVDYLAFGATAVVLLVGSLVVMNRVGRVGVPLAIGGGLLGLAAVIAIPVLKGTYINERFSTNAESTATRLEHWRLALAIRNDDVLTTLLGMGKGSFPRTYFLRGNQGAPPSTHQYASEDGVSFLRLTGGDDLYMGQRVSLAGDGPYLLSMDLRTSSDKGGALSVPIFEKSILYAMRGKTIEVPAPSTPRTWKHVEQIIDLGSLGQGPWYSRRPVELGLYNGHRGTTLDVRNVRLATPDGRDLVKNGDFAAGQDWWFFSSGNHLPWHCKNLWVGVLFEDGWVGLAVFVALTVYVLGLLCKRILAGDRLALLLLASLVGFFAVGLSDSVFDEPRMTLLLFLVVWISMAGPKGSVLSFQR